MTKSGGKRKTMGTDSWKCYACGNRAFLISDKRLRPKFSAETCACLPPLRRVPMQARLQMVWEGRLETPSRTAHRHAHGLSNTSYQQGKTKARTSTPIAPRATEKAHSVTAPFPENVVPVEHGVGSAGRVQHKIATTPTRAKQGGQ